MSFEEIPHTADVKIRVRARTLDALFSDAFLALMHVVYGDDRCETESREIHVESGDSESLLLDFLSEVLFISEVESLVFSRAAVTLGGQHLSAVLYGEPFDRVRHGGGREVKGVSYSGLVIFRDANGYILDILFDV
jgi:SHS2 domain-containing protein